MTTNNLLYGLDDQHICWLSGHTGLHLELVKPWQTLCLAAKQAGFELAIASGFRSFERQLSIWNRKFNGELAVKDINNQAVDISRLNEHQLTQAILTFSALPGTSRHHWGTDIDVYSPTLLAPEQTLQLEPWEYQANGPFAELSQWLKVNAATFGFYFPYDRYRGGVAEEPWHLSYFPLARQFQQAFNARELAHCLQHADIMGKISIISELDNILTQYVFNLGEMPDE